MRNEGADEDYTILEIEGTIINQFIFSSIARKTNSKVYSSTLMNSTNKISTHAHRKYFERSVCNSMFF